ncbi:MAG: hypothetical protein Q8P41_15500, partial [Pseudomonadota bacterium]|nr:hypothetical protein [Pseudomonadota bacterium]
RAAAQGSAPRPPGGAHVVTFAVPGGAGAVWLDGGRGGLSVRVDGATVEVRPVAPGLVGSVEGRFETDSAFTKVTLDADTRIAVVGAAAELLEREAAADPARLRGRFEEALAAVKHDHAALLGGMLSPWGHVPLAMDTAGRPLDLPALRAQVKARKRLIVGSAGGTAPAAASGKAPEVVVAGDDRTIAQLRSWFPGVQVEHVDEARLRKASRRDEKARRHESGTSGRREQALAERAGALYTRWTGGVLPKERIVAVLGAWASGAQAGWPPFASVDADGPWAALVAFAAGVRGAEDAETHLLLVEGLARTLAAGGGAGAGAKGA